MSLTLLYYMYSIVLGFVLMTTILTKLCCFKHDITTVITLWKMLQLLTVLCCVSLSVSLELKKKHVLGSSKCSECPPPACNHSLNLAQPQPSWLDCVTHWHTAFPSHLGKEAELAQCHASWSTGPLFYTASATKTINPSLTTESGQQ